MLYSISALPRSMPNADQNHGIDPKFLSRELSFITGRGGRQFVGGGPEFFGVVKGGDQNFFQWVKGGTRIF